MNVQKLAPFSAGGSQNVNDKSCLICVKSEKYIHSGLPSVPRVHEVRTRKATYIKTNFSVLSGPKQLCPLANLGCIKQVLPNQHY